MTKKEDTAFRALADFLAGKVAEAMKNGAIEEQAVQAVRALWVNYLKDTPMTARALAELAAPEGGPPYDPPHGYRPGDWRGDH
jgi:glycyl-tRNA synthetase beta subunit